MLIALVIALLFFLAMIVAVLFGSPDQRTIVRDCIDSILNTI